MFKILRYVYIKASNTIFIIRRLFKLTLHFRLGESEMYRDFGFTPTCRLGDRMRGCAKWALTPSGHVCSSVRGARGDGEFEAAEKWSGRFIVFN